jgi:hypothetical protein
MQELIKKLEAIKKGYAERHSRLPSCLVSTNLYGRMQAIDEAIDLIRAEMPLTVRELAEHLQKKDPSRQKNISLKDEVEK